MKTSYSQKKIAIISDMAGYGKCALTVSLPIISAFGMACCPIPTAVFSNHTGYPDYYLRDLTEDMPAYIEQWKQLHFSFDGILSGYLSSEQQMDITAEFIRSFRTKDTVVIIDPVMGDHGKTYAAYTFTMCEKMKSLIPYADILTPNLTEACILTDTPYQTHWTRKELTTLGQKLSQHSHAKIVITGIKEQDFLVNLCCEQEKDPVFLRTPKVGKGRHGTGDIFSSILAASAVNGAELSSCVTQAADFIQRCLKHTDDLGVHEPEGVIFEDLLYLLHPYPKQTDMHI